MGQILTFETKLDERGRILIPKELRKEFRGRKIILVWRNKQLRAVPKIPLKELVGITPGISLKVHLHEKEHFV